MLLYIKKAGFQYCNKEKEYLKFSVIATEAYPELTQKSKVVLLWK